jgi:hypothetical protein
VPNLPRRSHRICLRQQPSASPRHSGLGDGWTFVATQLGTDGPVVGAFVLAAGARFCSVCSHTGGNGVEVSPMGWSHNGYRGVTIAGTDTAESQTIEVAVARRVRQGATAGRCNRAQSCPARFPGAALIV